MSPNYVPMFSPTDPDQTSTGPSPQPRFSGAMTAVRPSMPMAKINNNTAGFRSTPQGGGMPGMNSMVPGQTITRDGSRINAPFMPMARMSAPPDPYRFTPPPRFTGLSMRGNGTATMAPSYTGTSGNTDPGMFSTAPPNTTLPMYSGAKNVATRTDLGMAGSEADAADRLASQPGAPINRIGDASNSVTMQQARSIYGSIESRLPGDENKAAREDEFHSTMARWGVSGPALLKHWQSTEGSPQTSFVRGFNTTAPTPTMPLSMLGANPAGGTPPPGMAASERGQHLGGQPGITTPVYGPQAGATPLAKDFSIPPTSEVAKASAQGNAESTDLMKYARLRDVHQQAFSQDDADNVRDARVGSLRADANARQATTPVTGREQFQANTDVAQTAAQNVGKAVAARTANASPGMRQGDRVSFFKSLNSERVDDGKGGVRRMNYAEKVKATNDFFGGQATDPSAAPPAPTTPPNTFAGGKGPSPITSSNAGPTTKPATPPGIPHQLGNNRMAYQQSNGTWLDESGRPIQG